MDIIEIFENCENDYEKFLMDQDNKVLALITGISDPVMESLGFVQSEEACVDMLGGTIHIYYKNPKTFHTIEIHNHDSNDFLSIDYDSPFQYDMENFFCWRMEDEDKIRIEKLFDDGVIRKVEDLGLRFPRYILEYQQFLDEMMEKCEMWGKKDERSE